jgi:hypothetical protein
MAIVVTGIAAIMVVTAWAFRSVPIVITAATVVVAATAVSIMITATAVPIVVATAMMVMAIAVAAAIAAAVTAAIAAAVTAAVAAAVTAAVAAAIAAAVTAAVAAAIVVITGIRRAAILAVTIVIVAQERILEDGLYGVAQSFFDRSGTDNIAIERLCAPQACSCQQKCHADRELDYCSVHIAHSHG